MALNLIAVNPQMQRFADNAVVTAKDKFGVNLDYTENSLHQLELLLQQAHERYKQASTSGNSPNILIENTVRVWGSYFGEVILLSLGGDWIVYQKDVYLQLSSQIVDPLGQVRSRIVDGQLYNVQSFFHGLKSGIPTPLKQSPIKPLSDNEKSQTSSVKKGTKNRSVLYIAGIIGTLIIISFCIIGVWILSRQGGLAIPGFGNPFNPTITLTNTIQPPTATPLPSLTNTPLSPTDTLIPSLTYTPRQPTDTPLPTNTQGSQAIFDNTPKTIEGALFIVGSDMFSFPVIAIYDIQTLNELDYDTAKAGNIYAIVKMRITNPVTGGIASYGSSNFFVVREDGIRIDPMMFKSLDCELGQIVKVMAGATLDTCVIFEVQKTSSFKLMFAPYGSDQFATDRDLKWDITLK